MEDPGRIIHPLIVDGQIAGAVAQGIGGALYEHLIYDEDGNLSTGSLLDYLMPTSAEIPELVIGHVAHPAANPLGVRGVGEGGTLGPAAALAGAVGDALASRSTGCRSRPAASGMSAGAHDAVITQHRDGDVTVVEIDRHERRNALDTAHCHDLREALTGGSRPPAPSSSPGPDPASAPAPTCGPSMTRRSVTRCTPCWPRSPR